MRLTESEFEELVRIPNCELRQKDCSSFSRRIIVLEIDNMMKSYQSGNRFEVLISCVEMLFPLLGKLFWCFPTGIQWTATEKEDLTKYQFASLHPMNSKLTFSYDYTAGVIHVSAPTCSLNYNDVMSDVNQVYFRKVSDMIEVLVDEVFTDENSGGEFKVISPRGKEKRIVV
jgi:hypothetical protein